MSETGFRIFQGGFLLGTKLLYALILTLFLQPFLERQEYQKRKLGIVFAISCMVWLLCDWLAVPQGAFGLLLTGILAAASGALGLERPLTFELLLFYCNARISSGLIVESLYVLMERALPVPVKTPEAVYLRSAILIALFLLSHAAALSIMLYVLQRQLRKQQRPLCWREVCAISIVPLAGILFGQIISRLLIEYKDGVYLQLYERHPAFLAVVPLIALLFHAGAYLTLVFQQGIAVLRKQQAVSFAQRQQTQAIRARIQEMEQFYTHIRRLKHEVRGHFTNIQGLVRNGEYDSLETYIAQMNKSIHDFELALPTGNPVTDVIVNDKRQQCLKLGIRFQADFHYPEIGAFDAFDVGIILQNLLQNALEACEKAAEPDRFIILTGKQKGRFFLIEVKNSFAGEIRFGSDGLPFTTKKEDAFLHGIGLSNVRREAEKYMGELELKTERQEFSAAVLLQERSSL